MDKTCDHDLDSFYELVSICLQLLKNPSSSSCTTTTTTRLLHLRLSRSIVNEWKVASIARKAQPRAWL